MSAIVLSFAPVRTVAGFDCGRWRVTVRRHGWIQRTFYRPSREDTGRTTNRIRGLNRIPGALPIPQACKRMGR